MEYLPSNENRPSNEESSIPTIHFQVRAVSVREGIWYVLSFLFRKKIGALVWVGVLCNARVEMKRARVGKPSIHTRLYKKDKHIDPVTANVSGFQHVQFSGVYIHWAKDAFIQKKVVFVLGESFSVIYQKDFFEHHFFRPQISWRVPWSPKPRMRSDFFPWNIFLTLRT